MNIQPETSFNASANSGASPEAEGSPLTTIMSLARSYAAEDLTASANTADRLGLCLGHFFMALMPASSQQVVLTLTRLCLTELALERLANDATRRKLRGEPRNAPAGKPRKGAKS